jgi:hypothetical protein
MPLNTLLDSPVFYRYKNRMKTLRILLGLWLATAILACSALPDLPTIPPGWTVTPSLSPTPEATFTPTLVPTPIPAMRADAGNKALFNGDYDSAFLHYSLALQDSPTPPSVRRRSGARRAFTLHRNAITKHSPHCKPSSPNTQSRRILDRPISFRDSSITALRIIKPPQMPGRHI